MEMFSLPVQSAVMEHDGVADSTAEVLREIILDCVLHLVRKLNSVLIPLESLVFDISGGEVQLLFSPCIFVRILFVSSS